MMTRRGRKRERNEGRRGVRLRCFFLIGAIVGIVAIGGVT